MHTKTNSSYGGVFVETLIILPLVLAVLLILVWFGVMQNAKASLTQAVNNAVRLALTRSQFANTSASTLPAIDSWYFSGAPDTALGNAIAHNPPDPSDPLAALNISTYEMFGGLGYQTLKDLPPAYAYSMAYLNQALQLAIGPSVRFPCEPDSNGVVIEGCVNCSFLDPADGSTPVGSPSDPFSLNALGIECRMMPGSPLIRPISSALRLLSGGGYRGTVITRKKYYPPPID